MSSVYYVTMPFINYYVIMLLYLFMSSVYYVTMSFIDELLCYSVSLLLCPHREGDAVTAAVDIEHLHLHMLVELDHIIGILDIAVGQL